MEKTSELFIPIKCFTSFKILIKKFIPAGERISQKGNRKYYLKFIYYSNTTLDMYAFHDTESRLHTRTCQC